MAKDKRKKPKPGESAVKRPRNPFAGRPQSGAGYHSESRYGKKDRRSGKKELEEEDPAEEDPAEEDPAEEDPATGENPGEAKAPRAEEG